MKFVGSKISFQPRDLWVGIYWRYRQGTLHAITGTRWLEVYICVLPMVPLRLKWELRPDADTGRQAEFQRELLGRDGGTKDSKKSSDFVPSCLGGESDEGQSDAEKA